MIISSFNNEKIKYLRSLYNKKYIRLEKKFVLEGVRIIEEAIDEKANILEVFYSEYLLRNSRGVDLLNKLSHLNIDIHIVDNKIINQVSDTETPQGVLAVVEEKISNFSHILEKEKSLILIIDQVQDPGNLGTIIRTADAAGVDGIIIMKGTVSLYNQKSIRATMGSLFRVPIYSCGEFSRLKDMLVGNNIKVVVGDINGEKYHFDIDYLGSIAIVVGNEGNGPSRELLNLADEVIKIPLLGGAESLNVAMATGVMLYEGVRQRMRVDL